MSNVTAMERCDRLESEDGRCAVWAPGHAATLDRRVTQILDVPVDRDGLDAIAARLVYLTEHARGALATYVNAHGLNVACSNSSYRMLLQAADAVIPDGMGIVWISRWLGQPIGRPVQHVEVMEKVAGAASAAGWRWYLLGGTEETLQGATHWFKQHYPLLRIVGTHPGYFPAEASAAICRAINAAQPHLLVIGMGAPRQELWWKQHRDRLTVNLCWTVGGTLELMAGRHRAPAWMQRHGLEWCYRLWQEPTRLWRRYLVGHPLLLWRLFRRYGLQRPDVASVAADPTHALRC